MINAYAPPSLTPREIVKELDRFIIGQDQAKKAVAIALRNRWRRLQLDPKLREEVIPKNILMIGPTGVGKTEISRRLAKLAQAPFIKVEATKFTEIGYVGRDVEQIIRDLLEIGIQITKERFRHNVQALSKELAEERVLDALVGETSTPETRHKFRIMLHDKTLDDKKIEIQVTDSSQPALPTFDVPGLPGAQVGMINLSDILGKGFGKNVKTKTLAVSEALVVLAQEESDKLLDQDLVIKRSVDLIEQNGIVFIDEIDKICAHSDHRGADVSREGVQRDLLPLIEGTTVSTKHGPVKTDHILFITSGAFHLTKPSDLLPELQGRLPIRVELKPLTQQDFVRILTETEANLVLQYQAMLKTEGVDVTFTEGAVSEIAFLAAQMNLAVENIGARRLHTLLEKLLEDIGFTASERSGETVVISKQQTKDALSGITSNLELSKFIL